MQAIDYEHFHKNGFLILDILDPKELEEYRKAAEDILPPVPDSSKEAEAETFSSEFQHLGADLAQYGRQRRNYYFRLLTKPGTEPLHRAFLHPRILKAIEALLGPDPIINNGTLLAAEAGTRYNLGWHRDVIQIPQDEIDERIFSPRWFHNSTQLNLALYDDSNLWAVPGSHSRPNTLGEDAAFAGSRHYAPRDATMPGGLPIHLKAGQAAFYNNNIIHRGFSEAMPVKRRTLHLGFHSASRPPTWHFYFLDAGKMTPEYLATLDSDVRRMLEAHLECRRQYPDESKSWPRKSEATHPALVG